MSATIPARISEDLKSAMRARDAVGTNALRMLRAAILELEKSGEAVTDEGCVAALRRLRKQREEAAQQYRDGGREDLVEAELADLPFIDRYLPTLADEATTRAWVKQAIAEAGATSARELGKVMGALTRAHRGEVDSALANRIAREELGG